MFQKIFFSNCTSMCTNLCISFGAFIFQAIFVWNGACFVPIATGWIAIFLLMQLLHFFFTFLASDFCCLKAMFAFLPFCSHLLGGNWGSECGQPLCESGYPIKEILLFATVDSPRSCCMHVSLWEGHSGNWRLCLRIFVMVLSERPRNLCSILANPLLSLSTIVAVIWLGGIPVFLLCDDPGVPNSHTVRNASHLEGLMKALSMGFSVPQ